MLRKDWKEIYNNVSNGSLQWQSYGFIEFLSFRPRSFYLSFHTIALDCSEQNHQMAPGIPAPVSTFLYNPLSLSVGRSREIRGK